MMSEVEYNPATDPAMKSFTLRQLAQAIRENGLERIEQWFFKYKDYGVSDTYKADRELTGGCALGQGCYNLKIDPNGLYNINSDELDHILDEIIDMNDIMGYDFPYIADQIERLHYDVLDKTFYAPILE